MKIASGDLAGIIAAISGGLGIIFNFVQTWRQGKVQRQHGADIADLQASTGTHKALPPDA